MKSTNWPEILRAEIRQRAESILAASPQSGYRSLGGRATVLFARTGQGHANFYRASWDAIAAESEWLSRMEKAHTRVSALPEANRTLARELDSSNSSDALLMNVFCAPGAASIGASIIGASPIAAKPVFGWKPSVTLVNGNGDETEIDMRLGDTICEAKLTEHDFTSRSVDHVKRYAALDSVFEVDRLPRDGKAVAGYQLIRNVLAAAQHRLRLAVLIDSRRPDLLQSWWRVHAGIRDVDLRSRCTVHFWQELVAHLPEAQRAFLRVKYGF
jgi:hypothetical protein